MDDREFRAPPAEQHLPPPEFGAPPPETAPPPPEFGQRSGAVSAPRRLASAGPKR